MMQQWRGEKDMLQFLIFVSSSHVIYSIVLFPLQNLKLLSTKGFDTVSHPKTCDTAVGAAAAAASRFQCMITSRRKEESEHSLEGPKDRAGEKQGRKILRKSMSANKISLQRQAWWCKKKKKKRSNAILDKHHWRGAILPCWSAVAAAAVPPLRRRRRIIRVPLILFANLFFLAHCLVSWMRTHVCKHDTHYNWTSPAKRRDNKCALRTLICCFVFRSQSPNCFRNNIIQSISIGKTKTKETLFWSASFVRAPPFSTFTHAISNVLWNHFPEIKESW